MAILLATWLGAQEYIRDAEAIFNDLFDRAFRDLHPSPTHPIVLEVLFDNNLKCWNLSDQRDALYMLPAALRAVTEVPSPQIAEKVLQIITWAADELCAAEHREPHRDESILESLIRDTGTFTRYVVKSLAEAIHTLIRLAPTYCSEQRLQGFLTPDFLKRLFHLVKDPDAAHWFQVRSRLRNALLDLCEGIPENYVGLLFSVARSLSE